MNKKFVAVSSLLLSLVLTFSVTQPAKAFYLEVPEFFKTALKSLQSKKALAQEGGTVAPTSPPPPSNPTPPPPPNPTQPPSPPVDSGSFKPPALQPQEGQTPGNNLEFKQLHQGAEQMDNGLRKFDSMMKGSERDGGKLPPGTRDNFDRAQGMVNKSKSAQNSEDAQNINGDELDQSMRSLDQSRQEMMQKERRLKDMRRMLSGMERAVTMFERQVTKLTKQKIAVPQNVTDALQKVKDVIAKLKATEDADEAEELMQDLPDLMDTLNESRQQLEMLSRWPQTLKQLDRELKNLTRELSRSKAVVDRLLKKEIDLTQTYSQFEAAVNKLKGVRDEAVAKVASGNAEEAFELLEEDFFGQMQDVWEHQRVIQTMSNLGRFVSDFSRGVNDANRTIATLKRKKIDTSDLEGLLVEIKAKGEEVKTLLKAQPLDDEAVMSILQDLENTRQQFENQRGDLLGEEETRPWEGGGQNFKSLELPPGFKQAAKKEPVSEEASPASSPQ